MPVEQRRRRAPMVLASIAVLVAALPAALAGCGGKPAASTEALPAASSQPAEATSVPPSAPVSASPPAASGAAPAPASGSAAPARRPSSSAAVSAANDASRLRTLPATTTQVVIVQAPSASSTTANLRAYVKQGAVWRPALPAMTARLGGNGFGDSKREGDKKTPTGVYGFDRTMYGIAANPGVKFAYHRVVTDDWWNENSDSPGYNTFHHGANPGGPSEPLWQISPQYTYFAVINYNVPATPGRGSGIFLHQGTGGPTLGCVSLPQADLVAVLRWLDPAANPRIVMSPTSGLSRY